MFNKQTPVKITGNGLAASCQVFYRKIYIFFSVDQRIYPTYNTMTLKKGQVTNNKHVSNLSQSHIMQAGIKTHNFYLGIEGLFVILCPFIAQPHNKWLDFMLYTLKSNIMRGTLPIFRLSDVQRKRKLLFRFYILKVSL